MPQNNELGLVATLAELEAYYKDTDTGNTIELMNKTNDILDDVPWMESNHSDGHLTRIRTGLPTVYWRRLYQGTPPSKSAWSQVKEGCGLLEALNEMDIAEVELYGDRAKSFRMSEGKAFAEAMRQKVATTLFYGDNTDNPDEFNGLAMRYSDKSKPNVIDAGGTGNKCTSMYLVCWGSDTAHGLYPKGSSGGFQREDLGKYVTIDANGNKYQCVGEKFNWRCGLTVRDWRAVVRIANLDVAKLTLAKGQQGFIDLQKLTILAKNAMPEAMRTKAIWYCNSEVLTALELQSSDAGNVHLHYGEMWQSKAVPNLHGRPIRQCDALLTTEKAI